MSSAARTTASPPPHDDAELLARSRSGRFAVIRMWLKHFGSKPNSVLERQLCTLSVYLLAQPLLLVPGVTITHHMPVLAGGVVIFGATFGAVLLRSPPVPSRAAMAVPLADILAVGLLRAGTGGVFSIFTIMVVLPVISLGVEPGRLPLLFGGVVTVATMLLPLAWDRTSLEAGQWVRIVFAPLILGLTCLSVNELTSRLRSRIRAVQSLQRQQESLVRLKDSFLIDARSHASASEAASALARDSTRELRNIIDSVTEQAIIATDGRGLIEVFNAGAQKMLHIAAHDVLGRSILQFHPPETAGGFEALVVNVREGFAQEADWTYLTHDHRNLRVHVTVTARRDSLGEGDGFLFVATDVTDDREQSRLKDEFVNLISHELRTPLSSILGYLELLADDDDHPMAAEQRQFVEIIERNANRLLRLVSDLLFTAQVEAGQFDLQGQPVDLRTVLASSVENAMPSAVARDLTLRTFAPEHSVTVWGDPLRLGQAVDNLIVNAIKFTPPGGRVAVTLTAADETTPQALICVTDTGLGIPAGELHRLFSRFFRASTATQNAVSGVGLGLNITKAIVTAHGGHITVASTVDEGTTFAIELPLSTAASAWN